MKSRTAAHMSGDNMMTEVALALAMAFFSIMVLTMVSMGAGGALDETATQDQKTRARLSDILSLTRSVGAADSPANTDGDDNDTLSPEPGAVVIFDGTRFLTAGLDTLPTPWRPTGDGPVVLAIPPSFSLTRVSEIQARLMATYASALKGRNVVVTALDKRWQDRLNTDGGL